MSGKWRKVVWNPIAEDSLRELVPEAREADDFISAAESLLADDPFYGNWLPWTDGLFIWCTSLTLPA